MSTPSPRSQSGREPADSPSAPSATPGRTHPVVGEARGTFAYVPLDQVALPRAAQLPLERWPRVGTAAALGVYQAQLAEVVFTEGALEGNGLSLTQVRQLLHQAPDPAGLSGDAAQSLAIATGAAQLIGLVGAGRFELSWRVADGLNAVIARSEAIAAGVRRSHSSINPDGRGAIVDLAGDLYIGPDKEQMLTAQAVLLERAGQLHHPVLRAVTFAALAAYCQFYFDGNKRTGRFMMNGYLMAHGFAPLVIGPKHHRQHQAQLAQMFRTADPRPYIRFLLTIAPSTHGT